MNEQEVYDYGRDCGINGANTTNCNFGIFSRPEFTKAWERGKASVRKTDEEGKV